MKGPRLSAILLTFFAALTVCRAHQAGDEMAAAADKFLSSLKAEQSAKASFEMKSEERVDWHFVPKERKGLPLKEMTGKQRAAALGLLRSGLSDRGFAVATNIMGLERILQDIEGPTRRFSRDPDLYHVSIFGKPAKGGTWGWRVEGHHLSVNFTIVGGQVAATPSFFGTNPAEVRKGPHKGLRVLADEEDLARAFVKSLNEEQRKEAIYSSKAPSDILTEAKRKVTPLESAGIAFAKLNEKQRESVMTLIKRYVERVRPEVAKADLDKIQEAGMEKIQFAWAGDVEPGKGHYYRIQGPTFLMEYDNTQNDANHIHAVWRDFKGDFGEDILSKHYREQPH